MNCDATGSPELSDIINCAARISMTAKDVLQCVNTFIPFDPKLPNLIGYTDKRFRKKAVEFFMMLALCF